MDQSLEKYELFVLIIDYSCTNYTTYAKPRKLPLTVRHGTKVKHAHCYWIKLISYVSYVLYCGCGWEESRDMGR